MAGRLAPVIERVRAEPGANGTLERRAEEANVLASLAAVRADAGLGERVADGRLRLHGWLYDMATGRLRVHDDTSGTFRPTA